MIFSLGRGARTTASWTRGTASASCRTGELKSHLQFRRGSPDLHGLNTHPEVVQTFWQAPDALFGGPFYVRCGSELARNLAEGPALCKDNSPRTSLEHEGMPFRTLGFGLGHSCVAI